MKNIIIFDYDGVIVDSLAIFMENFIFACKKEKWGKINNKKDFLKLFDGNMYESMLKMGITHEKIFKIINVLRKNLLKNQSKIKVFYGINEVVKKLSYCNILAIITSNETVVVENFLKANKINCFQEIIGSDKGLSKIEKIRMIQSKYPNSIYYYIGDTKGDIVEGKIAGINTVAVTWGWHDKDKLVKEKPEHIVHSPNELLNLFD